MHIYIVNMPLPSVKEHSSDSSPAKKRSSASTSSPRRSLTPGGIGYELGAHGANTHMLDTTFEGESQCYTESVNPRTFR